jgi:hypothetical protein
MRKEKGKEKEKEKGKGVAYATLSKPLNPVRHF